MAICNYCMQDMLSPVSCTNKTVVFPNGLTLEAVVYDPDSKSVCHDCGTPRWGFHHPGCDMERCPACGGQLISCGCLDTDDEDDEDDTDDEDDEAADGYEDDVDVDLPPGQVTQSMIRRVLEWPAWPEGLEANHTYDRLHDDTDGADEGRLLVIIGPDGDAWVRTDSHRGPTLRFRSGLGGGSSPRTRNALLLLAYAMKLDAEEGRKF